MIEDLVTADAPPNDVRLARDMLGAIGKRCASVAPIPGHFVDSGRILHRLDPQTAPKRPTAPQVNDKPPDRQAKSALLRLTQPRVVLSE